MIIRFQERIAIILGTWIIQELERKCSNYGKFLMVRGSRNFIITVFAWKKIFKASSTRIKSLVA